VAFNLKILEYLRFSNVKENGGVSFSRVATKWNLILSINGLKKKSPPICGWIWVRRCRNAIYGISYVKES
jgi:hypothetical protein